jgi:hypothetical protein
MQIFGSYSAKNNTSLNKIAFENQEELLQSIAEGDTRQFRSLARTVATKRYQQWLTKHTDGDS